MSERELRKELKALVAAVEGYLSALDIEMRGPPSLERGRRIAHLSNGLDMAKDFARLGLGIDLGTGKPRKRPKATKPARRSPNQRSLKLSQAQKSGAGTGTVAEGEWRI